MRFHVVFFDIGGVLERTPATGWQQRWEVELGLPQGELDVRLAPIWKDGLIGSVTEADVEREVTRLIALPPARADVFFEDIWHEYLGSPNQELIDYFASLRAHHPAVRTGIISNSFVGAREREEVRYGFSTMCEHIVYSHEVGIAKPDAAIFSLACEQLAVRPPACVFVDDVIENVHAASVLGMHAIQFQNNQQTVASIEAALRS